ncbi:MAG: hypothetical protein HKN00_08980 [Flavobacteriaceae bacterium]|nr:hypothetical protein [Bacteroidia bacterium]NNF75303.1 hypothetical protein [Flavobacteriaceae bacterium]
MKNLLSGIVIITILVGCATHQNLDPKDTKITLFVTAQGLYGDPQNNDPNVILANCQLNDNQGAPTTSGPGIPSFQSKVFKNKMVTWDVEVDVNSDEAGYSVAIEQIEMKFTGPSTDDFFIKKVFAGKSGKVMARVKNADIQDKLYYYNILFSVKPKTGPKLFFEIDPILKGNN